ncbi:hypothetical protein ANAEL_03460 [Anaerolineales bacterium]|nr:hypothetical protein ANAEL_03460 [Anaerolineales bacterium]
MPTKKRALKVFLCHAHADREAVYALYTRLTEYGVDAWLDKKKLLPGQDWELEIRKAVREADVVVVCLSKQFNQAGFRQKEVRLALDTAMEKPEGDIFIIPARLDECENLESLRKWHWVDLFEKDGYQDLVRALRARADKIGATLRQVDQPQLKEKRKEYKLNQPLWVIVIIAVIFIIGLSFLGRGMFLNLIATPTRMSLTNTSAAISPSKIISSKQTPTKTPIPPTPFPTVTPSPEIQQYFTEEFDHGYENWSHFLRKGDNENFSLSLENGGLIFNIAAPRTYAYLVYELVKYKDVRIDVHTQNFGVNENNVTIFCRYTPDAGWYEFNLFNNGLYNILFTKPDKSGNLNYGLIAEGGSNKINQGRATNEYAAICEGRTLTLYINGVLTRTVEATQYELSEGKVGFSVSSYDSAPVQVSLDWIRINKP